MSPRGARRRSGAGAWRGSTVVGLPLLSLCVLCLSLCLSLPTTAASASVSASASTLAAPFTFSLVSSGPDDPDGLFLVNDGAGLETAVLLGVRFSGPLAATDTLELSLPGFALADPAARRFRPQCGPAAETYPEGPTTAPLVALSGARFTFSLGQWAGPARAEVTRIRCTGLRNPELPAGTAAESADPLTVSAKVTLRARAALDEGASLPPVAATVRVWSPVLTDARVDASSPLLGAESVRLTLRLRAARPLPAGAALVVRGLVGFGREDGIDVAAGALDCSVLGLDAPQHSTFSPARAELAVTLAAELPAAAAALAAGVTVTCPLFRNPTDPAQSAAAIPAVPALTIALARRATMTLLPFEASARGTATPPQLYGLVLGAPLAFSPDRAGTDAPLALVLAPVFTRALATDPADILLLRLPLALVSSPADSDPDDPVSATALTWVDAPGPTTDAAPQSLALETAVDADAGELVVRVPLGSSPPRAATTTPWIITLAGFPAVAEEVLAWPAPARLALTAATAPEGPLRLTAAVPPLFSPTLASPGLALEPGFLGIRRVALTVVARTARPPRANHTWLVDGLAGLSHPAPNDVPCAATFVGSVTQPAAQHATGVDAATATATGVWDATQGTLAVTLLSVSSSSSSPSASPSSLTVRLQCADFATPMAPLAASAAALSLYISPAAAAARAPAQWLAGARAVPVPALRASRLRLSAAYTLRRAARLWALERGELVQVYKSVLTPALAARLAVRLARLAWAPAEPALLTITMTLTIAERATAQPARGAEEEEEEELETTRQALTALQGAFAGALSAFFHLPVAAAPAEFTAARVAADCYDGALTPAAGETDVDCGGSECAQCADGARCAVDADCLSARCVQASGKCAPREASNHASGPATGAASALLAAGLVIASLLTQATWR